MILKMVWIEEKDEWHMLDDEDRFINEFYDCPNIDKRFPNLDKKEVNLYRVDIEKINR